MPETGDPKRHEWRDAVLRDPRLSKGCFKIAYAVSSFINAQTNVGWPSINRLAAEVAASPKTAGRHVRTLERSGYLVVNRTNRRRPTNEYSLVLPKPRGGCDGEGDKAVHSRGHSGPKTGDTNVPQIYLKNLVKNLSAASEPGSGNSKTERSRQWPSSAPITPKRPRRANGDRGAIEIQVANRLGSDGMDRLCALPEQKIEQLCAMQRAGRLSEDTLLELRLGQLKPPGDGPASAAGPEEPQ